MGEIEMQSGAGPAAVEQFRLALSARPNDRHVRLSLAQALNAAGQFDEAAGQLEPLTTDPAVDRALALKELAIAYHGMGRKDEAIDALQRGREAARKSINITHGGQDRPAACRVAEGARRIRRSNCACETCYSDQG